MSNRHMLGKSVEWLSTLTLQAPWQSTHPCSMSDADVMSGFKLVRYELRRRKKENCRHWENICSLKISQTLRHVSSEMSGAGRGMRYCYCSYSPL
jgi:hypothetical protein